MLRNEAAYLKLAAALGMTLHAEPLFESDTLWVRRFDRQVVGGAVERLGMESLCSLAGVAEYGARIPQERLARALARYSTRPDADLRELVLRDVLNVALGNTDNHARNSAVLKDAGGQIRLSPLFDFAPMILDEAGIPRVCRWSGAETGGFPDWPRVAELVEEIPSAPGDVRAALGGLAAALPSVPERLRTYGADDGLVERLAPRIEQVRRSLGELRPSRKSRR